VWLFCGSEPTLPDSTTDPTTVRDDVGSDVQPGAGSKSGGITKFDHDGNPSTPEKLIVPGIDTIYESPDANNVFPHTQFLPDEISPNDVTNVVTAQLNPGEDLLPDLIVFTKSGVPAYTLLNDPSNPGTLQKPNTIGSAELDTRDAVVGDVNSDGVQDLIVINFDGPNSIYYGDPTRPGNFELTRHDEFGGSSDGTVGVQLFYGGQDTSMPPNIIVVNENTFDQLYLGSNSLTGSTGAGTGLLDEKYQKFDLPGTDTTKSTDVDLVENGGLGAMTDSVVIAISTSDGGVKMVEFTSVKKTQLLDGTATLSTGDVMTLDATTLGGQDVQGVEISEITGDGIPDVVVLLKNGPVAGYIYPGTGNLAVTSDYLAATKIAIGTSGIDAVEMTLVDTTGDGIRDAISILDSSGGVHVFKADGLTWPSATYPDPNIEDGSTTGATKPHDHQDSNGVVEASADLDSDGFPDVISGNQLLLSSMATIKGDWSTVTPINYNHGPAPLAVQPFDADGDGDLDVFVVWQILFEPVPTHAPRSSPKHFICVRADPRTRQA
jgi:hypothetical protein